MSTVKILSVSLVYLGLVSCVSAPAILQGDFSSITPSHAKKEHILNQKVRWSGFINNTINQKDRTCFEIIETETEKNFRPKKVLPKNGSRFLACKEGFMEPKAFNNRMVTITGSLAAYTEKKIEEFQYEYPIVKTDLIYIWRKQVNPTYFSHYNFVHHRFSHFSCRFSFIPGYCY